MSIITCKTCGKKEKRQRCATYCISCGNKRISAAGRAKSKIGKLKNLMQDAIRDFHGKSVLFSAEFLLAAENPPNAKITGQAKENHEKQ